MNHLHVLHPELYQLNNVTLAVELDISKVFHYSQIAKMPPAQLYFTAECPTLRVQQGGNQKCYVRSSFQKKEITQCINALRIVDASVILLAIAKMAQPPMVVSLLVHLLQVVHSTPRLYRPLSAIAVAVPII